MKLSIIIPVYNVAAYLPQTIESVLDQTWEDFELILVDDGSGDGSGIICDEYAARDSRIRVIHQENAGVSAARNAGVAAATGEFIGFVDSDDIIERDMYQVLLSHAEQHGTQIAQCQHDRASTRNGLERSRELTVLDGPSFVRRIFTFKSGEYTNQVSLCTKVFRRELFDGIVFPVGRVYEDEQETYKACLKAERIVETPDILYHYICRQNSIITGVSARKMLQKQLALLDRLNYLPARLPDMEEQCARSFLGFSQYILCRMYETEEEEAIQQAVQVLLAQKKRLRPWLNRYERLYLPGLKCRPIRNIILKQDFAPIQNTVARLRGMTP